MLGTTTSICSVFILFILLLRIYTYWYRKKVKTGHVTPIFGDTLYVLLGIESFPEMIQKIYNKSQDIRYIGTYQLHMPLLLIRSPELIKEMCVRDFDHFLDHRPMINEDLDKLWAKNLSSLKGNSWKKSRSAFSPSFTGSKLKSMLPSTCRAAESFVQYFLSRVGDVVEVDCKDIYSRYVTNSVASLIYGIQTDSLVDQTNEFHYMGREASGVNNMKKRIVLFLHQLFPEIAKFFQMSFFGKEIDDFFINIVKHKMKLLEEENMKQTDIVGLLLEARMGQDTLAEETDQTHAVENRVKGKDIHQYLTDIDIASQAFVYFNASYETISSTLSFMSYELAVNPEIQNKLIQEIDNNKDLTQNFDAVMEMPYLDMVISETLRKWPNTPATDRFVTKPYTIQPTLPGEEPVHLEIGDNILVPIFALHRDPKYYADPERFDPERFSPENRKNINPFAYLPFGVGPRRCLGMRFALLQIKVAFIHILSKFEIVPVEKTDIPLKISRLSLTLTSGESLTLGLKKRIQR
ncbi:hypothetical protein HHI36_015310 [Cryptolaemus montrouzieri]